MTYISSEHSAFMLRPDVVIFDGICFLFLLFALYIIKKKRNYYKRKKNKYTIIQLFAFRLMSRIGGVMVSVLGSSAVNRGFE